MSEVTPCEKLETVAHQYEWRSKKGEWRTHAPLFVDDYGIRELVTRQNAEEVIAAKDARIAELEEHFAEMTRSCLAERDRNKTLEADNKRLREALETIADGNFLFPSELRFSARAALGGVKP